MAVPPCAVEQIVYFLVRRLRKIVVPKTHRPKGFRRLGADNLIRNIAEGITGLRRRNRYRDHDLCRSFEPKCLDCGTHGRTGRQAIIDQNHSFPVKVRKRSIAAILSFSPLQLGLLDCRYTLNVGVGYASNTDEIAVEHANTTTRDRTHGDFFVPGQSELAHDKDFERHAERRRYFETNGNSTSRKRKDEYVGLVGIRAKLTRESSAGVTAITKS
jgi:hypothetical protein